MLTRSLPHHLAIVVLSSHLHTTMPATLPVTFARHSCRAFLQQRACALFLPIAFKQQLKISALPHILAYLHKPLVCTRYGHVRAYVGVGASYIHKYS